MLPGDANVPEHFNPDADAEAALPVPVPRRRSDSVATKATSSRNPFISHPQCSPPPNGGDCEALYAGEWVIVSMALTSNSRFRAAAFTARSRETEVLPVGADGVRLPVSQQQPLEVLHNLRTRRVRGKRPCR